MRHAIESESEALRLEPATGNLRRGFVAAVPTAPQLQIFTLGRFSIAIGGEPFSWRGKAQHKPLALLKVLISMGGRDVASTRLCECLWPDSEGDLGARNLAITLHRLRALLRSKTAVVSDNGKLSLSPEICWVDNWQFERLANGGLRKSADCTLEIASEAQLREAIQLYSGHFLAREPEESWIFASRLSLKAKFERVAMALVAHLENSDRHAEAIDVCLQALERDPFNEHLHQRLMVCYLKNGDLADAARTYMRCREALAKGLALPPSKETERLYLEGVLGKDRPNFVQLVGPSLRVVGA